MPKTIHTDGAGRPTEPDRWHASSITTAADLALSREIMEQASRTLPKFKRPQRVHFMEALPRTATGKVQRFKLRQMSTQNRGQAPIS